MPRANHVGRVINGTTILKYLYQSSNDSVWEAKCRCGATRIVHSSQFAVLKRSKTCRCARKKVTKVAKQTGGRLCLRCHKDLQINRYYHPGCLTLMTDKFDAADYGYEYVG